MAEDSVVLDASALLALLQAEEGADLVESLLDGALMSSVNLSEVIQKAEQHGIDTEGLEPDLEALGIGFRSFEVVDARSTAERWTAGSGLSLGDRACLALAAAVGATALTGERRWIDVAPDVPVTVIR